MEQNTFIFDMLRNLQKTDETRNPMKPKSIDLDLRSWRNPCFKISENPHSNLGEKMKIIIFKIKLPI